MSEETRISPFESIRQEDEEGNEFWSARDLAKVLGYTRFDKFQNAILKAEVACANSGQYVSYHMSHVGHMITAGKGAKRNVGDVKLTRYACYLVVENADPSKPIVALGQTYFAAQTRRAELADEFNALPEDQKRMALRGEMNVRNIKLAATAGQAGVVEPKDFAIFQDFGYRGMYGGEKAADIHQRKGLKKNEQILDYMGSEELANNIFRAVQTDAKLKRENVKDINIANKTHLEVGKKVRKTIKELGGTMPEDLPTPKDSVKQLQQKETKRLKRGPQSEMFPESEEPDPGL